MVTRTVLVMLPLLAAAPSHAEAPFSSAAWATAYAVKRTEPIKIDGNLSEWNGVPGVKMAEEKFFFVGQGMSSAQWKGPLDLSASFRLRWDTEFLYLAIEVIDDKVTEPHGSMASLCIRQLLETSTGRPATYVQVAGRQRGALGVRG